MLFVSSDPKSRTIKTCRDCLGTHYYCLIQQSTHGHTFQRIVNSILFVWWCVGELLCLAVAKPSSLLTLQRDPSCFADGHNRNLTCALIIIQTGTLYIKATINIMWRSRFWQPNRSTLLSYKNQHAASCSYNRHTSSSHSDTRSKV